LSSTIFLFHFDLFFISPSPDPPFSSPPLVIDLFLRHPFGFPYFGSSFTSSSSSFHRLAVLSSHDGEHPPHAAPPHSPSERRRWPTIQQRHHHLLQHTFPPIIWHCHTHYPDRYPRLHRHEHAFGPGDSRPALAGPRSLAFCHGGKPSPRRPSPSPPRFTRQLPWLFKQ
jgi:hypothetical protein